MLLFGYILFIIFVLVYRYFLIYVYIYIFYRGDSVKIVLYIDLLVTTRREHFIYHVYSFATSNCVEWEEAKLETVGRLEFFTG